MVANVHANVPDDQFKHQEEIPDIVWFQDELATTPAIVGGKAANLSKLNRAGFKIPKGMIVTTAALIRHLGDLSIMEERQRALHVILSKAFHPCLLENLRRGVEELGDIPVAVRSSAVAEDLEEASFAGQYDTVLDVRGFRAIEEAVRKCWASALSERVRRYHSQSATEPMAVLIQPLVQADAAGVAFTANPMTGNRHETVVSAVRGLGERLVSGHAVPDEWIVYGKDAVAKDTPEKAVSLQQVLQIAEVARRVETFYGQPQDIEWAIQGNELYLLQARPITTLGQEVEHVVPVPVIPSDGFWEREQSHYPYPLTPATRTTYLPAVNHALRLMCDEMSLLIETVELKEIGGWVYQRAVPLGGKDRKAPPNWMMPLLIRVVPQLKRRIQGAVRVVREDKAGHWLKCWEADWKPELVNRAAKLADVKLQTLSDRELVAHLDKTHGFLKFSTDIHMKVNGLVQVMLAEYAFVCQELLNWGYGQIMMTFGGLSDMSSAPARELAVLASYIQGEPQLAQDIRAGSTLANVLQKYPEFSNEFEAYMLQFGCRTLQYELAFPTVAEMPETTIRLVRNQIHKNDQHEDNNQAMLNHQRQAQLLEAEAALQEKSEADRARFRKALSRAQHAYPLREEHGYHDRDVPLALLRYAHLEVGRRLVDRQTLNQVDEVFFLEFDEAVQSLKDGAFVRDVVLRRKRERNGVLAHPGPTSYGMSPPTAPSLASLPEEARFLAQAVLWSLEKTFELQQSGRSQRDAKRIQGIPVSAGHYVGKVRVIHDESEFDKIQSGDILVCPITSPVWSMLFSSIGALITDSGGILSHSAIIAREYRIPAIVGTGNATELLQDGQLVEVDGVKGVVKAVC